MGSQRIIRAFLFLMVIQLYCEILLAENGEKHSKSDIIIGILPEKSKYLSDSEYDDNLDNYVDYKTQYLDDLNSYKNSIKHSDNEYMSNLKQLSAHKIDHSDPDVTKVPARRSQSWNSEYAASLRQLSDRKMRYPDSDSYVIKMPARRSQSSNTEYAASLRQLSDRKMRYLDSDPYPTKVSARWYQSSSNNLDDSDYLQQYSDPSPRLDLSDSFTQAQRRNLEILPRFNSKHSDTIDLIQSSGKRYPIEYLLDQVSAKNLQAAQSSSKPSLRTYSDSNNIQQSNTRRRFNLLPALKLAKLGVQGASLIPKIFGKGRSSNRYHSRRTLGCIRGTQLINNRCEPISYSENDSDAKIKKIVRISDMNLDRDLDGDDEKEIGDIAQISTMYKKDRNIGSYEESEKE